MTKEHYLEMCEQLGTEPLESEIPVDYEDLPTEVQESLKIYHNLQDNWDYMGGNYIGKNLAGFIDILTIFEVETSDYKHTYETIMFIDRIRAKIIRDSKPKS